MTSNAFQSVELLVQDYCLHILAILVTRRGYCAYMLSYNLAVDILNVVAVTSDLNIQNKSLELFYVILDTPNIKEFFANTTQYSLKLLICYLKHMYFEIQNLSMRILVKLSTFRDDNLEQKMLEDGVIAAMFRIIMVLFIYT